MPTWDAVTSMNLNISMVSYLRRHLVCTVHCLHEQKWWLLMRWSCEKKLIDICFLTKSSLLALTAAYTKFRRMILSMIWSCVTGTFPDVLLPHRHAGRLHWGKAESTQLCDFVDGSSHYRCWSAILLIIPPMCSPSFGLLVIFFQVGVLLLL